MRTRNQKSAITPFTQALDEEFDRIASEQQRGRYTLLEQATFLGLSTGHLSRVRCGKNHLAESLVYKIAAKLRPDQPKERETLQRKLQVTATRFTNSTNDSESIELSRYLPKEACQSGSLLVGVYARHFDMLRDSALDNQLSEAIVAGMSFAIFQPFGTFEDLQTPVTDGVARPFVSPILRNSWMLICQSARSHYSFLRKLIADKTPSGQQAKGSLVLFEAAEVPKHPYATTSPRIFHSFYDLGGLRGWKKRSFEMVESKEFSGLAEFDGSLMINVDCEEQFHPITTCWLQERGRNSYGKLPATPEEIAWAYRTYANRYAQASGELLDETPRWKVYQP